MVLEPLQILRDKQFNMSGGEWDRRQEVKLANRKLSGQPTTHGCREYRVVLAADCVYENEFFSNISALMGTHPVWALLPVSAFTLTTRHLAYRMLARARALVLKLLVWPQSTCSLKLFQLLVRPSVAADIQALPHCVRGPFVTHFLKTFPDLNHQDAIATLSLMATELHTDIGAIETKHATIRRRLLAASHNTHRQAFCDAGADWCCYNAKHTGHGWAVDSHAVSSKVPTRANKSKPRRQRRGGGGAFRAFVSDRCKGDAATPFGNMTALAREYRALDNEQMRPFAEAGARATARHRRGGKSFGPTARERLRQADRARFQDALETHLESMLALEDGHPADDRWQLQQFTGIQFENLGHGMGGGGALTRMNKMLSRARFDHRAHQAAAKERRTRERKSLLDFQHRFAKDIESSVTEALGFEPIHAERFAAIPAHGRSVALCSEAGPAATMIASALAAASTRHHGRGQLVIDAFEKIWADIHSEVERGGDVGRAVVVLGPCFRAGFCMCSRAAKIRQQALTSLYRVCKQVFRKESGLRALLEDGKIVADVYSIANDYVPVQHLFAHLALMYFHPYEAVLHSMRIKTFAPEGPLELVATQIWISGYDFANRLDLDQQWRVQFWEIIDSPRPIAVFDTALVEVELLGGPGADNFGHEFWPPPPKPPRKKRKRRGAPKAAGPRAKKGPAHVAIEEAEDGNPDDFASVSSDGSSSVRDSSESEDGSESLDTCEVASQAASSSSNDPSDSTSDSRDAPDGGSAHSSQGGSDAVGSAAENSDEYADMPTPNTSDLGLSDISDLESDDAGKPPGPPRAAAGRYASVPFGCGELRHYHRGDAASNNASAHCKVRMHKGKNDCKIRRTCNELPEGKKRGPNAGQGRPLGLLAAWLLHECDCQQEHKAFVPSWEARRAARTALKRLPDAGWLFARERPQGDDPDSEPEHIV